MAFRLIVGLGNPGAEYRETRHNIGFMIVDRLAALSRAEFKKERTWKAEVARIDGLHLCKPLTYMNLSGESVRAMSDFYKIAPSEVLVVLDDMALPLGKLRLRPGGSAGGHNGLKSILAQLSTPEVPRLRVGIGEAGAGEAVGHVLGRFSPAEREPLESGLNRALSAIEHAQKHELSVTMNLFN